MDSSSTAVFFAWDEANRAASAAQLRGELLQMLSAAILDAGALRNAPGERRGAANRHDALLALLRDAVASTQRIAAELRPLLLEGGGIGAALQGLAVEHARRTGQACELAVDESLAIGEPLAIGLYRIAQDWVHGYCVNGVHPLHIAVASGASDVILRVHDDGVAQAANATAQSQALAIVAERVHLLGGSMSVERAPGAGTRMEARLPAGPNIAG